MLVRIVLGSRAGGKNKYPAALTAEREQVLGLITSGICNLCQVEECRPGLAEAHVPALLVRIIEQTRR